jgi:hypothetical protein
MIRSVALTITLPFTILSINACTALNFSDMIEPASSATGSCNRTPTAASIQLNSKPQLAQNGNTNNFAYLLPPAIVAERDKVDLTSAPMIAGGFARPQAQTIVSSFADYSQIIETSTQSSLPKALQGNPVVTAFIRAMIKASAQAQIATATAGGIAGTTGEADKVANYQVPSVSISEVKEFSKTIFSTQLRPTITAPQAAGTANNNIFAKYFSDFYDGKFVDRFGQTIAKPSLNLPNLGAAGGTIKLSLTITDAEISAALTVLIEYLADLVDPTPVLGSSPPGQIVTTGANATKFYPGGNTSEPTALVANIANYRQISTDCGITETNAKILGYIANGAGDEAQLVNGLVTQSAGGFGFSLGIFGKISIGDNQTLGTIVKTAASRAAMRIVFASSYWTLERVGQSGGAGKPEVMPLHAPLETGNPTHEDVGGPTGYLKFPE